MPHDFQFPLASGYLNSSELWIPLSLRPEEFTAFSGEFARALDEIELSRWMESELRKRLRMIAPVGG